MSALRDAIVLVEREIRERGIYRLEFMEGHGVRVVYLTTGTRAGANAGRNDYQPTLADVILGRARKAVRS